MNLLTKPVRLTALVLACNAFLVACGGSDAGPATQTITFGNPGTQTVSAAPVTLSATASSGLAVTFTTNNASVCTVSGSALTLVAAGTCSISAGQAGNSAYQAATTVTQSFTVDEASQTITFANPGDQTLNVTPAPLSATASSGLAVSFASTTPSVCTVSGTALTLVGSGQCSITASQAGDTSFAAAASVTDTFGVSVATLTFLSGYQSAGTIEGGGFGGYAGGSLDGYFCNSSTSTWCSGGGNFSPTVSAASSSFFYSYNTPSQSDAEYMGIYVQAPGVTSISSSGDTGGVQLTDQTTLNFNLAENAEWFATGNTGINITLIIGHLVTTSSSSTCNMNLSYTLAPTAAASTAYSIPLSSFTVSNAGTCDASTSAATALASYPISQIVFQTVTGNAGSSAVQNTTTSTYPTQITLTGGITFH